MMVMRKVLITGLMGSGKSELSRLLRTRGYSVYDSDSRTKALYGRKELADRIRAELGLEISQLSQVFEDGEKLAALEAIVHPLVLEDFLEFAAQSASDPVFFESAIALDKPLFQDVFDKVILVRASDTKRYERNPQAERRSLFQRETERWDYLIENEGSLKDLEDKVDRIIKDF